MVYVPSRYLRPTEPYTVGRSDIKRFAEFKAHPTIRLGNDFKARVEASSRHLADSIVGSLERNDIAVHENEPVRDRVLRGRRGWVPAVLRYTAAGNAVLRRGLQSRQLRRPRADPPARVARAASPARWSKDSPRRMRSSGRRPLLVIRRSNSEF